MKAILRYAFPIVLALLMLALSRYFFPAPASPEARKLRCVFELTAGASPATFPASAQKINRINFNAELSGKSVHEDTDLWSADGVATFEGNSQALTGPVFLWSGEKVRGLSLYRDRYPHQSVDLRISTLNDDGELDWDEHSVFVYFNGAPSRLSHLYTFRCDVTKGS